LFISKKPATAEPGEQLLSVPEARQREIFVSTSSFLINKSFRLVDKNKNKDLIFFAYSNFFRVKQDIFADKKPLKIQFITR
jgi:hypothetical protein